jgi:hypothetical protein
MRNGLFDPEGHGIEAEPGLATALLGSDVG